MNIFKNNLSRSFFVGVKIIHKIFILSILFLMFPAFSFADTATFTSSGVFTVPNGVTSLTVDVVAGGGAGGGATNEGAGPGGGGGGRSYETFAVSAGQSYSVVVGGGGAHGGAPHCEPGAYSNGVAGGYSAIGSVIAYGGGGAIYNDPGAGGYGSYAYGSSGGYPSSRWGSIGGAGGASGAGAGAGGAGGWSVASVCLVSGWCNETSCECAVWSSSGSTAPQPGGYYGGGGGGMGGTSATCDYQGASAIYGGNGAPGYVNISYTVIPPPTASVSVSPSPVSPGTNPGFTLSSTNAYYCYVYLDYFTAPQNVATGYFTSGTYYPGALTSVGAHTANAYCYNSAWVGSGWSTTNFTVAFPPTIDNVTINDSDVYTDATSQHIITSTASDSTGGNAITDELALINYQGVNASIYRGYLGWSSIGFYFFGGSYKIGTTPISCSGGGSATIYNGYGPQYINLISCSTSISGNTRTVSYVVTFNTNFNSPINNNTISGYAYNNTTGLASGWLPFDTFSLLCSNGGCTEGICNNGTINPPTCSNCPAGYVLRSTTNSCVLKVRPTASIVSPAINVTISESQTQQFTGTASDDDGTIVDYSWRLDSCSGTLLSTSTSFIKSFIPGVYRVYFKARDNDLLWSTCQWRLVTVTVSVPINGVCGSAHGAVSQKKPTSNLCNTVGLPGPVVLPSDTSVLPEGGTPSSWTWTCAGEYGGTTASCSSNTSCGDNKCQPSKGESPSTCRADCKVKIIEF
jgi:hypothetical protein